MTIPFSRDEMLFLSQAEEFQKILSTDAHLDALDAEQYNRTAEVRILSDMLGISGLPFFTAAKWAVLWIMNSPYVCGGNVSAAELRIAMFVLSAGNLAGGPETIRAESAKLHLCKDLHMVHEEICSAVRNAFLPLAMLPSDGTRHERGTVEEVCFDLDWLCRICSIAARESGESFTRCVHSLPLSALCSLYVNYRRRTSPEGKRIGRRATPEIAKALMDRTYALGREFLDRQKKKEK